MPGKAVDQRGGCIRRGLAACAVLCAAALVATALSGCEAMPAAAEGTSEPRVYPHVYVADVNLQDMTREEAIATLRAIAERANRGEIVFRDGEKRWAVPRAQTGITLDVEATCQAALAAGRDEQGLLARALAWVSRHDVDPVFAIDTELAQGALRRVGSEAGVAPTDSTFRLQGEQIVTVPGQPGRVVDVEATLVELVAVATGGVGDAEVSLVFRAVPSPVPDASALQAQVTAMLSRQIHLSAYDVVTDETFAWTVERKVLATWLELKTAENGKAYSLQVDPAAVQATLTDLAAGLGQGRGFRLQEATQQVVDAFNAGGGAVALYLTHPARTYTVQAGDTLTSIGFQLGMPPTIIAEANRGIDPNTLSVGQQLAIPSQDVLTPHLPVAGKRIVVSISHQRMRVYENGALRYDWVTSTGISDSPTQPGVFQVLEKVENAYASRWNLWMPHFMAVYRAGPDFYNGIHALPILNGGGQLWAGYLGRPVSYGCIVLGVEEAATLYQWAEVGTTVVIER